MKCIFNLILREMAENVAHHHMQSNVGRASLEGIDEKNSIKT